MTFFKTFPKTFKGREFYAKILSGEDKSGFGYAYILNLFVWIIVAIYLTVMFALGMPVLQKTVIDSFPPELQVTIQSGLISINQPEPYFIATPASVNQKDELVNIIVIDTKTPFDITQFAKYNTGIIIKKDSIASREKSGGVRIVPTKDIPNYVVNKGSVTDLVRKLAPFGFIIPILFLAVMVTIYFGLKLLGYLVVALLVWGMLAFMDKKVTFGSAYRATLYAGTLPAILAVTMFIPFSIGFLDSNWITGIVILAVVYWNTRSQKTDKTEPTETVPVALTQVEPPVTPPTV